MVKESVLFASSNDRDSPYRVLAVCYLINEESSIKIVDEESQRNDT